VGRILVVTFVSPYPLTSGGARDIYNRLSALNQAGYEVDLIVTSRAPVSQESIEALRKLASNVWTVVRRRDIRSLLSFKPFQYQTRRDIRKVALSGEYFAVILESEFVGAILDNPTLNVQHKILRVHNNEPYLYKTLAQDASSPVSRLLFLLESAKLSWYSKNLIRRCDHLWFISSEELSELRKNKQGLLEGRTASLLPTLVDPNSFRRPSLSSSKVFYAGALSIPINQQGLLWYLNNIHPNMLSDPAYEFLLAGQTGDASIEPLLRAVRANERVRLFPNAEDLTELQNSAGAFINPIQRGAGVKIKTIDAAVAGLPVVTTTAGAEGTHFVHGIHAIIADSAEQFEAGLKNVLTNKILARSLVTASQAILAEQNGFSRQEKLLSSLNDYH